MDFSDFIIFSSGALKTDLHNPGRKCSKMPTHLIEDNLDKRNTRRTNHCLITVKSDSLYLCIVMIGT